MKVAAILYLMAVLTAWSLKAAAADLFQAAAAGRTEDISLSILGGADLNAANENGWTPLMFAASRGDLDAVNLLLAYGADPEAAPSTKNVSGFTALMAAAYYGHPGAAAALLRSGADPDAADTHYYGETALMLAVKRREPETVKVLLAGGADADAGNRAGVTPLMYAASYGDLEVIRLLLAAGADVSVRDNEGLDALRWAHLAGPRRAAVRDLLRSAGE